LNKVPILTSDSSNKWFQYQQTEYNQSSS